ncbi:MAG: GGDEF domain-containing protein, partial [Bacillota bacterium]|nr:GGDEF domain-containing protein [Bacillota bacterium]
EDNINKQPNNQFGIVMADIDDFKKVNDVYGHQFGDEVLIEVCNIISSNIGSQDFLARYGGEELIIYVDDVSDRKKVFQKIDNIRTKISEKIIEYENLSAKITISFGISYYTNEKSSLKNVLKSADDMLYYSKKNNKNRVTSIDSFNDLGLII